MKRYITVLAGLSVLIGLMGCNQPEKSTAKSIDLTSVRKDIDSLNTQFSALFVKGDSVGVANLYTKDAKFMDTGAPAAVGRSAIQTTMAGFMKAGITKVDFKTVDVFGCDSLVAEEGTLKLFIKDQQIADDKYIVLWKKEDGQWKIFRDISNSNLPATAAK